MIEINLENLETVIEDLGSLTEDHLLGSVRDHLRRRQRQLEADLKFADQARQQAERAISALRAELGLDRLVDLQTGRGDVGSIERGGFPGGRPGHGRYHLRGRPLPQGAQAGELQAGH